MTSQIATIVIVLVFVPSLFFMVNSHYFVKFLEKILEKKPSTSKSLETMEANVTIGIGARDNLFSLT